MQSLTEHLDFNGRFQYEPTLAGCHIINKKNCHRPRIEVRPTALPRYHTHTRWTPPGFGRVTPHTSPR